MSGSAQSRSGVDGARLEEGVASAATHWMTADEDADTVPYDPELVREGRLKGCYADAHDVVAGTYSGGSIAAGFLGLLLQALTDGAGS